MVAEKKENGTLKEKLRFYVTFQAASIGMQKAEALFFVPKHDFMHIYIALLNNLENNFSS